MSNPSTYMDLLCPNCDQHGHLKVIETRAVKQLNAIRRRRHCDACGHRFTTYERIEVEHNKAVQAALNEAAGRIEKIATALRNRIA